MNAKQARARLALQALVASAYVDSDNVKIRREALRAYGNARQGLMVLRSCPHMWREVIDEYCR